MKRYYYFTIIILALILTITFTFQSEKDKVVVKDNNFKLIVKFAENIDKGDRLCVKPDDLLSENIKKLLKQYNVKEIYAVFRNRYDNNGNLKSTKINSSKSKELSYYRRILINNKENAQKLAELLRKEKDILKAYIEEPVFFKPAVTPNDSDYNSQWHLNDPIHPDADIDAEQAWDINKGRNDVIIAVCDGGIDYTHPDLEPGDRSRIIQGYDSGSDDYDPLDDLPNNATNSYAGHGTNIAGVIGAITDNSNQVAGIMWNCKIMPIKMVKSGGVSVYYPFGSFNWDFTETAFPSDVADGIDYAVNNGAHIINLSYGFSGMGFPIDEVALRIPLLYDAITNAYNNNVVLTVSMGNEFEEGNPINYPAAFNHEVIAVGATNILNQRANFSSTGVHINVSAPGTSIFTTDRFSGINNASGTSFSAPVVAGVSGLILSQGKDRNFNLTNDDVRHILEITADDITRYGTGFDEETGHGKVNARRALELLDQPNVLYHGTSYGGSTSKTNLSNWSFIGNRWGLAAGIYYDVDRYEITKHITFDIPFFNIPEVWLRNRECVSLSIANGNDGFPFAEISNISETGFDVTYYSYYVRYNSLIQAINKWVPAAPNSTKIEYTAVGVPNLVSISGSSTVCNSNSTFTLHNRPLGSTITWTKSSNLTYVSGQGTNNYTVKANGSGTGHVTANVNGVSFKKEINVRPSYPIGAINGPRQLTPGLDATYSVNNYSNLSYTWSIPSGCFAHYCWDIISGQGTNSLRIRAGSTGRKTISVVARNICGIVSSQYKSINVQDPYGNGNGNGNGNDNGNGGDEDPCFHI